MHPLQPLNAEPLSGVAVSVTVVPSAYRSTQSPPQLTPAGSLLIVPLPVPRFLTVSLKSLDLSKRAPTVRPESSLTVRRAASQDSRPSRDRATAAADACAA